MTTYYARKEYNYSGGDAIFGIPFDYIRKEHISVSVNGEETENYTYLNNSQIQITDTLTVGDVVTIARTTPISSKMVVFSDTSILNKDTQNLAQDQVFDAVQEVYDNNLVFQAEVDSDISAISEVANTAQTNSNTAINTANTANGKADNAVSTANSANSKANNAVSTANTASNNATIAVNTANSAVNTANSASNTATSASNKVDEFGQTIEQVIEAAEKINELEEAVQTATSAATTASNKADVATNKATEATNAANRAEAAIPSQTGHNGQFLQTDGTNTSWKTVDALPSQTGQSGKFLTTDGTDASWETITIPTVDTDDITVSKNSDDELQTIGVIDQNNTTNAIKTWTGTKAQYDAIVTKDSTTMYYLTDIHAIYLGDTLVVNLANRNISEIIPSILPLTDAGLHLLDGALIQGSGIYADFVTKIGELSSLYPSVFVTEANWQTSVNTYGVCGKFVYDSTNNTVRLPKVTGIIEGTTDLNALGDLVQAGLPQHTHTRGTMDITGWVDYHVWNGSAGGAFYINGGNKKAGTGNDNGSPGSNSSFQASRNWTGSTSNANYTSTTATTSTVQPQTIKVLYYIVIATSAKTEIQVDIDNITTDLNGKADVDLTNTVPTSNFATALNTAGIRTVVETYSNGTSWYRVYSDGWCEQGGLTSAVNGTNATATINLLKTYNSTNYSCYITIRRNGDGNFRDQFLAAASITTSSFIAYSNWGGSANGNKDNYAQWFTAGYLA